jgi:hypothetical protein
MTPKPQTKPNPEFRMNPAEFNEAMRKALSATLPKGETPEDGPNKAKPAPSKGK